MKWLSNSSTGRFLATRQIATDSLSIDEQKDYSVYKFVNEWIRKKTIFKKSKYKKYDVITMPQVISIKTFYTSKSTSFFTFFLFLNILLDCTRRI